MIEKSKRPRSVLLLSIFLSGLSILGLFRFRAGFIAFSYFDNLEIQISPWFFIITGLTAMILLAYAACLTFTGSRNALRYVPAISAVIIIADWIDRIVLSTDPKTNTNWLFWGLITLMYLLYLGYVFWISDARLYFGEGYAQEPQNRETE